MFHWLDKALQENSQRQINSKVHYLKQYLHRNQLHYHPPNFEMLCVHNQTNSWMLFMEVRKNVDNYQYGASTLIRSLTGFSVIICKSLTIGDQRHAQILILREAFLRIKEFQMSQICCKDYKKIWRKFLEPSTPINWRLYPLFANIIAHLLSCR